jgi:hypothetical protein
MPVTDLRRIRGMARRGSGHRTHCRRESLRCRQNRRGHPTIGCRGPNQTRGVSGPYWFPPLTGSAATRGCIARRSSPPTSTNTTRHPGQVRREVRQRGGVQTARLHPGGSGHGPSRHRPSVPRPGYGRSFGVGPGRTGRREDPDSLGSAGQRHGRSGGAGVIRHTLAA